MTPRRIFLASLILAPLTLGSFAGLAASAEGKGDKAAWATIDKAAQAAKAEKLSHLPAMTWNEAGTYYGGGAGQPYTAKYAQVSPSRFHVNIDGAFELVLDGDKGWLKVAGTTQEMSSEQLKAQKAEAYAGWVASLAPLAKDRDQFTAAQIDGAEVAGRPTIGVSITAENRPELKLYFDKETAQVAKLAHKVFSSELNKEVEQEIVLGEYREIDGIPTATKFTIHRDGKLYVEGEMKDIKRLKTLDDSHFAKP